MEHWISCAGGGGGEIQCEEENGNLRKMCLKRIHTLKQAQRQQMKVNVYSLHRSIGAHKDEYAMMEHQNWVPENYEVPDTVSYFLETFTTFENKSKEKNKLT